MCLLRWQLFRGLVGRKHSDGVCWLLLVVFGKVFEESDKLLENCPKIENEIHYFKASDKMTFSRPQEV